MRFCQSLLLVLTFLFVLNMSALGAEKKETVLESITFQRDALKREAVRFKLKGEHTPKVYMIKGEDPRIVLDFVNTRCSSLANRNFATNGKLIKGIRVGIHDDKTLMTRVVIDLTPKGDYQYTQHFKAKDNLLLLTIASTGANAAHKGEKKGEKKSKPKTAKVAEAKKTAQLVHKGYAKPPRGVDGKTSNKEAAQVAEKGVSTSPESGKTAALKTPQDTPGKDIARSPGTQGMTGMAEQKTAVGKEQMAAPGKETPDVQPKVMPPEPLLSAVTFEDSTKGEMIIFKLNGYFPPKVVGSEKGEPRVICDFLNTRLGDQVKDVIHSKGKFVESVRITQEKEINKISAVLSLVPNRNYDLQQVFFKEDNLFVLIVNSQNTPQMENTSH